MFDIPQAKRVRRNELYTRSRSSSPALSSPDPELEKQFLARLASLYGPITTSSNATTSNVDSQSFNGLDKRDIENMVEDAEEAPENHEFEFRLFSTSATSFRKNPGLQKIILEEEDSYLGGGRFIKPCRDPAYYFASKAEGDKKLRFDTIALTGKQVEELSKQRAWGLEVPWRVRVLAIGANSRLQVDGTITGKVETVVEGKGGKRKKPGKKRRIILREAKKKRELLTEQRRKEQELKEETEKEKRTRKNREKKVKRKLREKAKKSGGNSATITSTANPGQCETPADATGCSSESD
ncbi:hypothetical protein BGZ60DRAFT_524221 [Tricladium varicosporioides]|nr:hypothetical protein BGZ60DRAFT_524221 [Hymenoscyphus varicosporioides]